MRHLTPFSPIKAGILGLLTWSNRHDLNPNRSKASARWIMIGGRTARSRITPRVGPRFREDGMWERSRRIGSDRTSTARSGHWQCGQAATDRATAGLPEIATAQDRARGADQRRQGHKIQNAKKRRMNRNGSSTRNQTTN